VREHVGSAFIEIEAAEVEHSHSGREGKEHLVLWRRREL
jgi:hypothetical protein